MTIEHNITTETTYELRESSLRKGYFTDTLRTTVYVNGIFAGWCQRENCYVPDEGEDEEDFGIMLVGAAHDVAKEYITCKEYCFDECQRIERDREADKQRKIKTRLAS